MNCTDMILANILLVVYIQAVKKRKAAAGAYKLPDPLPAGEILRDYCKKEWKLGKPIGAGGFGLIYLSECSLVLGKY